jgi:L-iditol 2-dehydrogenase
MENEFKAYFLDKPESIKLGTYRIPDVQEGEALIKLMSVNICPTDLKKYYHLDPHSSELLEKTPIILGHEGSGIVESVGSNTTSIKVGDKVAIDPMLPCSKCIYCLTGDYPMCLNLKGLGFSAGSLVDSQNLINKGFGGMFAEYVKAPIKNLLKFPDGLDYDSGALMEPLADVLHSIEAGNPSVSDSVIVFGLGAMGLLHIQVLEHLQVASIIGIDPILSRRDKALAMGADFVIDPKSVDPIEQIKFLTSGKGAHLAFICVGGEAQKKVTQQALKSVKKMGRIMLYASALKPAETPLDINVIHYNMLHVSGTVGFYPRHGRQSLELLGKNIIDVKGIRTPVIKFSQLVDAFSISQHSDVVKVGINIGE